MTIIYRLNRLKKAEQTDRLNRLKKAEQADRPNRLNKEVL